MIRNANNNIRPVPAAFFALLLLPLYLGAWGRFGLKVPAAVSLSLLTALMLAFFTRKNHNRGSGFPWAMFWVFPLFVPLGMPLWLIPLSLTAGWLIAVFCFGGYGKNIFNPLAIALVFILAGYASSVSIVATRPFPGAFDAFAVWTAGINPPGSVVTKSLTYSMQTDWSLLAGGLQPSLPGLAFPGVLLLMALFTGLFFGGRRIWLVSFIFSVTFFTLFLQRLYPGHVVGCFNILLMGITPALIFACLADSPTIPDCASSQVCHAMLLALLLVCFVGFSELVLHAAFALLFVQILCPLLIDVFQLEKH